jgi:rare lipoprotein A
MKLSLNLSLLFATLALTACGTAPNKGATQTAPVEERVVEKAGASVAVPGESAAAGTAATAAKGTATSTAAPIATAGKSAATGTVGGGYLAGDGPGENAPANLDAVPDATPKAEPLHPYANRQYVALGKTYVPLDKPGGYKERGIASWYGKKFHGQRTSSGETYDMYAMTAAHPTLPIPSYAKVTNLSSGKSVIVRINDRGPFLHDRIMDLSYTAAYKLGMVGHGSGEVEVESIAAVPADAQTPALQAAVADAPATAPLAMQEAVEVKPLTPEAAAVPAGAPSPAPQAVAATTTAGAPPVRVSATPAGVSATPAAPLAVPAAYIQLGAFKSQAGAESFLAKMRAEFDGGGKALALYQKDDFIRVHLGPYASADEARKEAEKLQARLGFKPLVSQH